MAMKTEVINDVRDPADASIPIAIVEE